MVWIEVIVWYLVITLTYLSRVYGQLAVYTYRISNVECNIQYHQDVDEMIFSGPS